MKERERYNYLMKQYIQRKKEFHQIIAFMKKNQQVRIDYTKNYCEKFIAEDKTFKEKIRSIFINAINAAGGNNLTLTGKACKNFFCFIEKLSDTDKIPFSKLSVAFNTKISDISDLYTFLYNSRKFPNFHKKKAALFIRDIFVLQNSLFDSKCIFENELIIPVDIVITDLLNKILKLKNPLQPTRDFDIINKFAKVILEKEYMLIEDLWFWGYFNLTKKGQKRIVKFNEAKYYADMYLNPSDSIQKKLLEFKKVLTSICKSK